MTEWVNVADGVKRRVIADGEKMMQVEVAFEPNGVGALHSHPHEQTTYILEGRIVFTVEGQEREMRAGEVIVIPGGKTHGVVALQKSVLLDTFSPPREDFR
jgi:quercetin dioxygenase-like cupin family protein